MLHVIFAAALASATPQVARPVEPSPLTTVAQADQKFGCAVLFVGADEVIRRNPALLGKMSEGEGGKAVKPLLKMMGASGQAIIDTAIADAVAQGEKPSDVYRRGVASVASLMIDAPVTKTGDAANEERGMALFTGCLSLMND